MPTGRPGLRGIALCGEDTQAHATLGYHSGQCPPERHGGRAASPPATGVARRGCLAYAVVMPRALAGLAVAPGLFAGCLFSDRGLPPLDAAATTTAATSTDPTTTAAATTTDPTAGTSDPTTGEPVPPDRAFRIDSLSIVDPHFFFDACIDGSSFLDGAMKSEIEGGGFNLVLRFEEFALGKLKPELIEVESCDLEAGTCMPKPGQVSLQVPAEQVLAPPCSQLDPAVISAINVPLLHALEPPCVRTARAELPLPIAGAAVPINLRESQLVFSFDDPADPKQVTSGLLYGFLTKASAEATTLSVLEMDVPLWPLIEAPMCTDTYPDQLPSVDTLTDGQESIPGVWMAVNFTAARIELLPPAP